MIYKTGTRQFIPILFLLLCCFFSNCQTNKPGGNSRSGAIRVLMVGGGASHDFEQWYKNTDAKFLQDNGMAIVKYTDNTDSIGHYLAGTDVLFLVNNQPIADPAVRQAIMDFADAGKGLVLAHAALWYNWNDWPEYNNHLVSGGSRGHDRYGEFEVTITNPRHPIMKGIPSTFTLKDELYYYKPDPAGPGITVLATARAAGSDTSFPSVFTVNHKTGRIAGIALGHDAASHNLDAYRTLLRNAVMWAAGRQ